MLEEFEGMNEDLHKKPKKRHQKCFKTSRVPFQGKGLAIQL